MTNYIGGEPPAAKTISLTKGTDKVFTLRRKDIDGTTPLDWDADVYMVIDTAEPQTFDAVITDDVAVIRLESDVCDELYAEKWRVIMSQAGSPSLETALVRGTFERND
jgi:hypothetical protein